MITHSADMSQHAVTISSASVPGVGVDFFLVVFLRKFLLSHTNNNKSICKKRRRAGNLKHNYAAPHPGAAEAGGMKEGQAEKKIRSTEQNSEIQKEKRATGEQGEVK